MAGVREELDAGHWGIEPLPEDKRPLTGVDLAVLWGDLAIGLLVLVAGGLLVPALSLPRAILAALLGSAVGCALLALGGLAGSQDAVPTMALLRSFLGVRGSWVPTILNVLQLVGWTAFEFWAMATVAAAVSERLFGFSGFVFWLLAVTAVVTLLTLWGPLGVVRKWMERFSFWAVLAIAGLLSAALVLKGLGPAWRRPGEGGLSFAIGMDLVIAMPISWLPLVADYNRFSRSAKGSFWGTYIGYLLGNVWFYVLGAVLVLAGPGAEASPRGMALGVLALGGAGVVGALFLLGLLVGETDQAFADVYSTAVSLRNIFPSANGKMLVVAVSAVSALLAAFLSMDRYELFLLLIGSVFVPLFGAWTAEHFVLGRGQAERPAAPGMRPASLLPWTAGFALYHWIAPTGPGWWVGLAGRIFGTPLSEKLGWLGASIPSFFLAFLLSLLMGAGGERRRGISRKLAP